MSASRGPLSDCELINGSGMTFHAPALKGRDALDQGNAVCSGVDLHNLNVFRNGGAMRLGAPPQRSAFDFQHINGLSRLLEETARERRFTLHGEGGSFIRPVTSKQFSILQTERFRAMNAMGMPAMMPMMNSMMPMMNGMMPMMGNMMGMPMPMMMCKMTCTMTDTGMKCEIMPMDPAMKDMMMQCCKQMTMMMSAGMPMMMMCGTMGMCCMAA